MLPDTLLPVNSLDPANPEFQGLPSPQVVVDGNVGNNNCKDKIVDKGEKTKLGDDMNTPIEIEEEKEVGNHTGMSAETPDMKLIKSLLGFKMLNDEILFRILHAFSAGRPEWGGIESLVLQSDQSTIKLRSGASRFLCPIHSQALLHWTLLMIDLEREQVEYIDSNSAEHNKITKYVKNYGERII